MSKAIIVLLLKLGKSPTGYRFIQIHFPTPNRYKGANVLPLNKAILSILHPDQTGFMPGKSTAINLRRVFLNMQTLSEKNGARALLSLNAKKAFDSVDWRYFWVVLERFGFGERFISWVHRPQAAIHVGSAVSPFFGLGRGT